MPNPIADLTAYEATVNADVTTQTAIDSISPIEVGAIGTDLSSILRTYLPLINNQAYYQGTLAPTGLTPFGSDLDLYYQQIVAGFSIWRKENGIWVQRITMAFVVVQDGILSGLRTYIAGNTVTVEKGTWSISNVRYSKTTQTQFTVPAADANYLRYDLIYADNTGALGYTSGTASTSPVMPTPASGQLVVDYVVVPSVASGSDPYLLSGSGNSGDIQPVYGVFDTNGEYDLTSDNIPDYVTVTVYVGGVQSFVQYDATNKKLIFGNPGDSFIAKFST